MINIDSNTRTTNTFNLTKKQHQRQQQVCHCWQRFVDFFVFRFSFIASIVVCGLHKWCEQFSNIRPIILSHSIAITSMG